MTSNQEVTIRLVLCAVGVPDFTGVEDIFRLTVGQSGHYHSVNFPKLTLGHVTV